MSISTKNTPFDPFQHIDEKSVGKLIETAILGGRATNPAIKLGICGEHEATPISTFLLQNGTDIRILFAFQGSHSVWQQRRQP